MVQLIHTYNPVETRPDGLSVYYCASSGRLRLLAAIALYPPFCHKIRNLKHALYFTPSAKYFPILCNERSCLPLKYDPAPRSKPSILRSLSGCFPVPPRREEWAFVIPLPLLSVRTRRLENQAGQMQGCSLYRKRFFDDPVLQGMEGNDTGGGLGI